MIKINEQEFKTLAEYILRATGIDLNPEKTYLVENRLSPLLLQYNCATFSEFYYKLTKDTTDIIKEALIDAITTQETLFFRDRAPFDMLRYKIIPELIDRKKHKTPPGSKVPIRILSAACSTGQEVYSIAMIFDMAVTSLGSFDIQVLGVDISDQAIARASYAHYNKLEISRGLSDDLLSKYFVAEGNQWRVIDRIRAMCSFRKVNLIEDFDKIGMFDIIFCRNMAIYFTQQQKIQAFHNLADILNHKGCLIIGASEYLAGICDRFHPQRHLKSVYYTLDPEPEKSEPLDRKLDLGINI